MNHSRLPKEDRLPDWARRDNKVTKGDRVECKGSSELQMQRIVQNTGPQKHMNMFLVRHVVCPRQKLCHECGPKRKWRSSAFWFRVAYEIGVNNFVWICWFHFQAKMIVSLTAIIMFLNICVTEIQGGAGKLSPLVDNNNNNNNNNNIIIIISRI